MDDSYDDTVRRLAEALPGLSPKLAHAARFMLDNPDDVALHSMRRLARDAGVNPATFSRLSRTLGLGDYAALREPFRKRLRQRGPGYATGVRDVQRRGSDDVHALFFDQRRQELANVEAALSDENYAELLRAVETLHDVGKLHVLGLRGAYATAFLFHYAYQLFRDNSRLVDTSAGIFADQLRNIGPDDGMLVISFRPYTQLTIDAVDYAAGRDTRIVAITDTDYSPVAELSTHTIVTPCTSPSFYQSFTAAVAVGHALITLLVAKTGGDAVDIVRSAERQLSRISAYW